MQDHTNYIFENTDNPVSAPTRRRRTSRRNSPVLSQRELQRIVAAMLG